MTSGAVSSFHQKLTNTKEGLQTSDIKLQVVPENSESKPTSIVPIALESGFKELTFDDLNKMPLAEQL